MKTKKHAAAIALVAIVVAGGTVSAQAGVDVNVDIRVPPPARRYEPVPSPRAGFVWVEGFWAWNGRRHEWVGGHWEAVRPGYFYRQPHWAHEGDHWRFREGIWEREHRRDERHDRGHDHDHDHDRH